MPLPKNLDRNLSRVRQRTLAHENPGPQRTTAVIHLGLGQVERILALDVARTHVIPNRVACDVSAPTYKQSQFRLRHCPAGIRADPYLLPRPDSAAGSGLEKQLRPLRRVDP